MTKRSYLTTLKRFLQEFWFIPSDALIRSYESEIWKRMRFPNPNLTIGCGDGRYDRMLFNEEGFDYAIDISKKDFILAKNSGFYTNVELADATKMPFKNNFFAAVIANSTIEHIKNDKKAIEEASRVLKKGGMFYFTTTTDLLEKELLTVLGSKENFEIFNTRMNHFHYRSFREWKEILEVCGLKVIKHSYYMNSKTLNIWYRLFKLFTNKFNNRELWSYLKDSKYSRYIPGKLIGMIEYMIVRKNVSVNENESGVWQYIAAQKI